MWPDLVLIDGGQGQLTVGAMRSSPNSASRISRSRRSPRGRTAMPAASAFSCRGRPPFSLEPRDPVLYFLQRLRDEAHRFAIGAHRAQAGQGDRRTRRSTKSRRSARGASRRCCIISARRARLPAPGWPKSSGSTGSARLSQKRFMTISMPTAKMIYRALRGGMCVADQPAQSADPVAYPGDSRSSSRRFTFRAMPRAGSAARCSPPPASPTGSTAIWRAAGRSNPRSAGFSTRSPTSCWSPRPC